MREQNIHIIQVLQYLETIATIDVQDHALCMLSTLMPPCLDGKLDTRIAEALTSTWETFNRIIPHTLWTMTINLLTSGYGQHRCLSYTNANVWSCRTYTMNDLIQDPHIAFKSDPRIFRSEQLLPIWLHVLSCLRTTSKHRIWKRYHTKFPNANVS